MSFFHVLKDDHYPDDQVSLLVANHPKRYGCRILSFNHTSWKRFVLPIKIKKVYSGIDSIGTYTVCQYLFKCLITFVINFFCVRQWKTKFEPIIKRREEVIKKGEDGLGRRICRSSIHFYRHLKRSVLKIRSHLSTSNMFERNHLQQRNV